MSSPLHPRDRTEGLQARATIASGHVEMDGALEGGLERGRLHEVYAGHTAHYAAATTFALGHAYRGSGTKPILWVRHARAEQEVGHVYAPGLAELGFDPARFILVRSHDPLEILRAASDALRSNAFETLILEVWSAPKVLDLTATRRFALSAQQTGGTPFLLRIAAQPMPSAAMTRWSVAPALSDPLDANAPGHPCLEAVLLRHRGGVPPQSWCLEWNRDAQSFQQAPLSGGVVSNPSHRPHPATGDILLFRRTA